MTSVMDIYIFLNELKIDESTKLFNKLVNSENVLKYLNHFIYS